MLPVCVCRCVCAFVLTFVTLLATRVAVASDRKYSTKIRTIYPTKKEFRNVASVYSGLQKLLNG